MKHFANCLKNDLIRQSEILIRQSYFTEPTKALTTSKHILTYFKFISRLYKYIFFKHFVYFYIVATELSELQILVMHTTCPVLLLQKIKKTKSNLR